MFEKRSEIRRAVREKIGAKGRNDAVDVMLRHAVRDEATGDLIVKITPEVEAAARGKQD